MQEKWRSGCATLVWAFVFAAVLAWVSYAFERSTGHTFVVRYQVSRPSTPQHLERTRRLAVGMSIMAAGFVALYLVLQPRQDGS